MNDINATTKLEWALQMAESIAVLHNHPEGVIVHGAYEHYSFHEMNAGIVPCAVVSLFCFLQFIIFFATLSILGRPSSLSIVLFCLDDVQAVQWLITEDGNVKLNDFNRAEFMLYDEEHGEYCKYKNGPGPGPVSTDSAVVSVEKFVNQVEFLTNAHTYLAQLC